jgi:hypothetical protein
MFNDGGFYVEVNGHKIYGYSRYIQFYGEIVANSMDEDVFVEVGSFLGQSTSAMGKFIKDSKKCIEFNAVDIFDLSDFSDAPHYEVIEAHGGDFLEAFKSNLREAGVEDQVKIHKMTSIDAAEQFEDRSVSFVMIDASHAYQDVIDDIKAWYPKVKLGGIISGDDFDFDEVKQAVFDVCGEKINVYPNTTWWFRKQYETLDEQKNS